jgi:hypothetical protein
MKRCSLILLLVATQLLSWSGPAVYLCWADDGSFGIDLGPQHCERCHHHADDADQCCEQSQLHSDCDCTHLPLSQQLPPTTIQRSSSAANQVHGGLFVTLSVHAPQFTISAVGAAQVGSQPNCPISSVVASLATIMLRC